MTFWNIPQGLREIPSAMTASDEPYSAALHSLLEHNQELIGNTILTRQLVNDYYPDIAGDTHNEEARPAGEMIAQWGRFEHRSGLELVCKIRAARDTSVYPDNTDLHLISTPKFLSPLIPLDQLIAAYATAGLYYDYVTLDSNTEQYWDLSIRPNAGNGNSFYLSLWKSSADASDPSEFYMNFVSIWEQPESS